MSFDSIDQVFIGGSRIGVTTIKKSSKIYKTLDIFMKEKYKVLVGDAPGSDKLVQDYLKLNNYQQVTVFHSTHTPRNLSNEQWSTCGIGIDSGVQGKQLMELKDQEMAKQADAGFMIWDDFHKTRFGKWSVSSGTLQNIVNLLIMQKPVAVFHVSTDTRIHFSDLKKFEDTYIFNRPTESDVEDVKNKTLIATYEKLRSKAVKMFAEVGQNDSQPEQAEFSFEKDLS